MCLILVGKKGELSKKIGFKKVWDCNPHGAGIVIPRKGRPAKVLKGIMTLKDFYNVLNLIHSDYLIAVHFRQATHGAVNKGNTHPFKIDNDTYLMHNGVLSGLGESGDKGRSDSAHLAEILSNLKVADRKAMLKALPGRYALVHKEVIHMYGDFDSKEVPGIHMSNTYWNTPISGYAWAGKSRFSIGGSAAVTPLPTSKGVEPAAEKTYDDVMDDARHVLGIPTTRWPIDGDDDREV